MGDSYKTIPKPFYVNGSVYMYLYKKGGGATFLPELLIYCLPDAGMKKW